jgi:hypothetical protein
MSRQYVNRLASMSLIPVAETLPDSERRYDLDEVTEALIRILCTNPEHPSQENPK